MDRAGRKGLDERIFLSTLETEIMTDEELEKELADIEAEIGVIETPKLVSDRYAPSDFFVNGKPHPRIDEIWEYVKQGTKESPEEIMAKFK